MTVGPVSHRMREQGGSSLILFLGIAAALGILAVTMVALLGNTMHNTSHEQTRTKAFDVAEAALNVTMQRLAMTWPDAAPGYTWSSADQAAFKERFGAQSVNVWVFDNVDDTSPGWETRAPAWDDKGDGLVGDGLVYVDAQAYVGNVGARIRAEVQKVSFELNLARGFAIWSGGTITASGKGNDPNVTAEDFAPGAYSCVAYAGDGFVNAQALTAGYVVQQNGANDPSEPPITQATIDELIQVAKVQGHYYSSTTAPSVQSLPLNSYAPPPGLVILDFRGLAGTWNVKVKPGTYNMTTDQDWSNPGALLVLGGNLEFGGTVQFCGLVYVDGSVGGDATMPSGEHGTPIIYGALVSTGPFYLNGTAEIHYVDEALQRLDSRWQTSTRVNNGGWRELQPRTGN
jgi:Tfp pilus assembly protein PilX